MPLTQKKEGTVINDHSPSTLTWRHPQRQAVVSKKMKSSVLF